MHPNCERFRELPEPYLKLGVNPIENLNKIETKKVGERPEEMKEVGDAGRAASPSPCM
jgi:hypothetical protein